MRYIIIKILDILSAKIISKYDPIVIGITGSVGKSSARKAIYEVLKTKYRVVCNRSGYHSDISIPLSIIGAQSGGRSVLKWLDVILKAIRIILGHEKCGEIIVLEMDVNKPGDMKKMLKVIKPTIGVFTGIGKYPSHLEYFKDVKHIVKEKSLLMKALAKKDLAILNGDDEYAEEFREAAKSQIVTFGFGPDSKFKAEEIFLGDRKWKIEDGTLGMSFKVSKKGTTVPFRLPYALGRAQIYAVLAACAVASKFDFNLLEISEILSKYQPLAGRMKLIKGINGSLIIDDSFNANPSSMLTSLESLGKLDGVRKIAVLGDMLEMGNYSKAGHEEVGKIVPSRADLLITFGDKSVTISNKAGECGMRKDNIFHFENEGDLTGYLKKIVKKNDVVLIKGSRAMRMENIVKEIMAKPELADELLVK